MVERATAIKIAAEVDRVAREAVSPLMTMIGHWPEVYQRIVINAVIHKLQGRLKGLRDD